MRHVPAAVLLLLILWRGSTAQWVIPPHYGSNTRNSVVAPNQEEQQRLPSPLCFTYTNHEPNAIALSDSSLYKRKADWQRIVDQFWGPGLPRSQKEQVFNTFADYIHDKFPCFGGLNVNWDSLRTFYAKQINDSTSRGGFSAILSRLAHALHDHHVMAWDTIMQSTPLNPGTPIFVMGLSYGDVRHFGAVLTPLPDSSLLVVSSVASHPLDLQPGDIILGYEGIVWKRLMSELLDSPLPRMGPMGSTESSRIHILLISAGCNWHLFDTIDVLRYQSGVIEHLPTASLSNLSITEFMANNEQVPVPSIPQPDYCYLHHYGGVTSGTIQGTNIGYIYVSKHSYDGVKAEFQNAVYSLMETDGLVLDLRHNMGGSDRAGPEAGLALLMNFSTQTLSGFERVSSHDLNLLKPTAPTLMQFSIQSDLSTLYGRPTAVLIGPYTLSRGEVTAYQFKYLPGVRFFGKPVNGALSGIIDLPSASGFWLYCPSVVLADHRDPSTLLVRREFPVDEPVWLDKDDVAHGDDTVVKRALGWIQGVAHAHDVIPSRKCYSPAADTLRMIALVENPNSHPISVKAYFKIDSTVVDSAALSDDGLHGDGTAGDSLWGTSWRLPAGEEMYNATVVTTDPVDKSVYSMPFSARFTTAGPIVFDSLIAERAWGDLIKFRSPTVRHCGSVTPVPGVTASIRKLEGDTVITEIYNGRITYGDIPPDTIVDTQQFYSLTVNARAADTVRFVLGVDLASNGVVYWTDTLAFVVGPFKTEFADQPRRLPVAYALYQNYPNPFNPTTTIRYDVAGSGAYQSSVQAGGQGASLVRMAVYDLLGREVAVLVNEKKDPGSYEVQFDAKGMASGVYFCRLQSERFVQTMVMILAK